MKTTKQKAKQYKTTKSKKNAANKGKLRKIWKRYKLFFIRSAFLSFKSN